MLQIRWHGHACFEVTNNLSIVTDPHDGKSIGIPKPVAQADVILVSHDHYDHNSVKTVEKENSKIITDDRKRTIGHMSVKGFPAFHDDVEGEKRGEILMYRFEVEGLTFCHLGDLGHTLDERLIAQIGPIDVLFIPIGGTYTLDAKGAWEVVNQLQPRIVVPMHYKIKGLSLPISTLDEFIEMSEDEVVRVGNEIDIENDDLPDTREVWVFTL